MVNPGIGHDKAETVLNDQQPRTVAHDALRLAEHYLDEARILVEFGGQRNCPPRGLDARHIDVPALSLGNDLLCDDQYVACLGRQPIGSEGGDGKRAEVIAGFDELDAGQRLDRDLGGHQPSLARSSGNTCSE